MSYWQFNCFVEMKYFWAFFFNLLEYRFAVWVKIFMNMFVFEISLWLRITAGQLVFFDRARPCSTVLEVCFNHARGSFRVCRRPKPLSRPFFFGQARTCICFWKPKHKVSNLTWERNPLSSKKYNSKKFKSLSGIILYLRKTRPKTQLTANIENPSYKLQTATEPMKLKLFAVAPKAQLLSWKTLN